MPFQFTNFATSAIAGGAGGAGTNLGATDTSLLLSSGTGTKFPAVGPFLVLIGGAEVAICTARSTDTLTLIRGQEGTVAQVWTVGSPVVHSVTAGALNDIFGRVTNVKDHGALGNGTADDTAAIQAALNVGGFIYLPSGTYKTTSTLLISSNTIICGAGWTTVITPSGSNFDVIAQTMPGSQTTNEQDGIVIKDLWFKCSGLTATTRGTGNAIHMWGWVSPLVSHCRFTTVPCYAILGEGSSNSGYNVTIENCLSDSDCGGGAAFFNSCEANFIHGNSFSGAQTTIPAIQPTYGSRTISAGYDLYLDTGVSMVTGNVFGNGGNTINEAVHLDNRENKVIGNKFDGNRYQSVIAYGDHQIIEGNEFNNSSQVGTVEAIRLGGTGYHTVTGNFFHSSGGGAAKYTYAIAESGNPLRDIIADNHIDAGIYGQIQLGTGGAITHHNDGYNPTGVAISAPASPTVSNAATGGTLTAGTYQVMISYINAVGETNASGSGSTTTSGTTSTLTVNSPPAVANATGWYAYVTQADGSTYTRQQSTPTAIGTNLTLTAPPTSTGVGIAPSNTSGITAPTVPASGTAYTNVLGSDCMVIVTGGTVTNVAVGGVTTGLTTGSFQVPANQTITLTYSSAPTWIWFGN